MNEQVTELDVICHYPKELSDEMVVLMRRITYLKSKMTNTSESQYQALDEVSDFSDFIYHLMETKGTTPFKFIRKYHFYELERYVDGDMEDDE